MSLRSASPEIALHGELTRGVVRVGGTVRRPERPSSASVRALLRHLETAGFDGAPRHLGIDELGRQVLTFVEGEVPRRPLPKYVVSDDALVGLARLLRDFHDAAASFVPPAGAVWERGSGLDDEPELVGHCDVTPENVVFRPTSSAAPAFSRAGPSGVGLRDERNRRAEPLVPYALIDFDLARPTTRLFDVVTTLRHWAPLAAPVDRDPVQRSLDAGARMRLFCDAYGLGTRDRLRLLDAARTRFDRSYLLMRDRARKSEPGWAGRWAEGAGARIRRAAAWLDANEDVLRAHLF